MPELPEVETIARTLAPQVTGCEIAGCRILRHSSLHPLSLPPHSLAGRRISGVGRRGKLLLVQLDAPASPAAATRAGGRMADAVPELVAVHLRMTGRLTVKDAATLPGSHTRAIFGLKTPDGLAQQLFFDDARCFGQIFAATGQRLAQWRFWRELGPEPLEMTAGDLAARLAGRRGALKAVLLDQTTLAGIGNIYADEALFQAALHPLRKAHALTQAECARLWAALRDVLRRSIAQCGSSIRDYRDANGDAGAFQNSFAVYGRGGQPCQNCGRPLERLRVAGRATVCCLRCQR